MIKEAGKAGDIRMELVAMMEDRYLMQQGKEQIYGTQGICLPLKGSDTPQCFIWPIEDVANVNERRKEAGIHGTVKDYCQLLFNVAYQEIKLSDLKHNPFKQEE